MGRKRDSKVSLLIGAIRDLSPGCKWWGSLTPAASLVLLEYKASSAATKIGAWGADAVVLTAMGPFSAQVNGWGRGEVSICPGGAALLSPKRTLV